MPMSCLFCGEELIQGCFEGQVKFSKRKYCSLKCEYLGTKPHWVEKQCIQCGAELFKRKTESNFNFNKKRFCSGQCYGIYKRKPDVLRKCKCCNKSFTHPVSHPREYCGRTCIGLNVSGNKGSSWKSGRVFCKATKSWMLWVGAGKGHMGHNHSYEYEHRVIAARALGRELKTNEVVHHIDENRANNTPSNLLICSRSYHSMLHGILNKLVAKDKM